MMSTNPVVLPSRGRVTLRKRREGAGAVHVRRLVQALRDLLEPGEEHDHVEGEVLPHGHQDDGRHREHRILEDVADADAEGLQPVVHQTDLRVEEVLPGECGDGEGDDERQEQPRAEHAAQGEMRAVEREGEQECEHDGPLA